MRVKLKGIALKRTKIRVVMSSAQFNNSSGYTKLASSGHGDQLFCKCLWCSGYALWMYGHRHIWRIFFFLIGWLVKRQMVVFSFFVSVFQIWSGTSPRSKLATQHWKRYNDVCVCVCVCVCTHVCVCVWCTTVFFHSLQHEDCCIKRQYVREREREGERVYSLCDKLTATKHS